jgi:hypothetical protein
MAKLIGSAPNQISTNGDLGSMAFEDRTNYITKSASVHQPFRNLIINGDMSIAQRGTSVSGITSGGSGNFHSVDRMALALSSAGTWTMSQETDVPSGQGFAKSVKLLCTTNEPSISSGGYVTFIQKFEGQNLQYLKYGTSNAEKLTLSFWIKSSKTGNFVAELANRDRSRYIGRIISINNADTWEKKTVTYEGYTTANFDNDNAWSMDVQMWFGSGTSFTSGTYSGVWQSSTSRRASGLDLQLHDTTNANVYLTGLQLEAGTSASDFEFLPYDVNLDRCIRYYTTSQEVDEWGGFANEDRNAIFFGRLPNFSNQPCNHRFPKRMRTSPTVTIYSLTGQSGNVSNTTTTAGQHSSSDSASATRISESGIGYIAGLGGASGDGYAFQYEADAEL